MKLRAIIVILCILAILAAFTGGYLYYTSLKKSALEKLEAQVAWQAEAIEGLVTLQVSAGLKGVRDLSRRREIQLALDSQGSWALDEANRILDDFTSVHETDVSYLMDRKGMTVAASNRHEPDSFLGNNYAFRPYFQKAIQGTPSVYLALGVTSGKRGVYYSHPVYREGRKAPLGVVVVKIPARAMEKELLRSRFHLPGAITLVTGPHGVIFLSNRESDLFQVFSIISNEDRAAIKESRQFGDQPLKWAGFEERGSGRVRDLSGREYLLSKKPLPALPGWQVVRLQNMDHIFSSGSSPRFQNIRLTIMGLCLVIMVLVAVLYTMARADLTRRQAAEEALLGSESVLKAGFESTADGILVIDATGGGVLSNRRFQNMWRIPEELVLAKDDQRMLDFVLEQLQQPQAFLEKVQELYQTERDDFDTLFFKDGRIFERYSRPMWQSGKMAGRVWSFRDVTHTKQVEKDRERFIRDLQAALDEVKTLRGILPICSHCKSIRDDKGAWNQLEAYLHEHSEARFSHGICNECAEKYYPDLDLYPE